MGTQGPLMEDHRDGLSGAPIHRGKESPAARITAKQQALGGRNGPSNAGDKIESDVEGPRRPLGSVLATR
eukprot:4232435-Lingulodinium_polyedra.AAC.1